jgi:Ca2+-transporting ATPase
VARQAVVFARVTPDHKLKIVEALQKNGEIVAVTGDGVNDAPALKTADLGVAMGVTGTDVAKEASAMVILDDDFATIVKAVEEGRKIYSNIRSYVRFTLAGNVDEILVITTATLLGLPLPLLPVQILFINLLTDGLPALALSNEPLRKEAMRERPRPPGQSILSGMHAFIVIAGVIAALATFTGFVYGLEGGLVKARTMAFATCIFFEMAFVFNCRQQDKSLFEVPLLSNRYLILAVAVSLLVAFAVVQLPFFQPFFYTTALALHDWLLVVALALTSILVPFVARVWQKMKK